jgi:hypothetical protein
MVAPRVPKRDGAPLFVVILSDANVTGFPVAESHAKTEKCDRSVHMKSRSVAFDFNE